MIHPIRYSVWFNSRHCGHDFIAPLIFLTEKLFYYQKIKHCIFINFFYILFPLEHMTQFIKSSYLWRWWLTPCANFSKGYIKQKHFPNVFFPSRKLRFVVIWHRTSNVCGFADSTECCQVNNETSHLSMHRAAAYYILAKKIFFLNVNITSKGR